MEDSADTPSTLDLAALEVALREAEPASMLLPSWLLEKIIAADRDIHAPLFSIPHDQSHVIARDRLLQLVSDEELPLPADPPDGPTLVLLARPDNDWLTNTQAPQALLQYWRLLFHAEIDGLLRDRRVDGTLDAASVQRRIERLGRGAFREAVSVLQRERQLTTTADDAEAYAEFAATYLELLHFEPWMLHWHFPAADGQRVLAVLSEDVDAATILAKTRPNGAADPAQEAPTDDADDQIRAPGPAEAEPAYDNTDSASGKRLLRRAQAAEQHGNDVRAAILRTRAARVLRTEAGKHRNGAARRVDALASRLRIALGLDESDYDPWRAVLRGLLSRADAGWWNNERRLLYDLQKACVCHEREIYSANVVEWLLDRMKRPLRRPQPAQRLVTAMKALRSAEHRALKARLHPHDRAVLKRLLHTAVERAAQRIRADLRPAVIKALEDGDLCPRGAVERVAQEKLVDELLDGVVRRGYLNLGNLRDAVSRNQLKLNDLSGPTELFGRDQLLRVDRKLEWALDGVYHRGEIYLRVFQRLSSVLFGTPWGRVITRVLLIPTLGSLILLEGLDHSVGLVLHKLFHLEAVRFARMPAVVMLAIFIVGLVNSRDFRIAAARLGRRLWHALRIAFFDFPRWLATLPLFRFLFASQTARLLFRYGVKPLAVAALSLLLLPSSASLKGRTEVVVAVYLAATLLLNSPAGRAFEQTILHALRVTLPRMTWDILVGLLRSIMHAFDRLLESVDRALYAVDEWLRFGSTHGGSSVAFRATLGVVWFYIAYVTRFAINLLVEPQINPIKHFPVVTVSHKIILPLGLPGGPMASGFATLGMSTGRADALAGSIVWGIPGIFGFLAWELRENWRLYRANRAIVLKAVRVGSHGETFAQLLRPGFHSGTLPKLFARVRKSARRVRERSRVVPIPSPKDREHADHLREEVTAFIDRELVNLLNQHPAWAETPIAVGEVELAAARVRIELRREGLSAEGDQPAVLTFDQRDGYVIATITRAAWIADLPETKAELLRVALLGLYKLAAVDLVTEHVMRRLPPGTKRFDVRHRHLIAWADDGFTQEVAYDLSDASSEFARSTLLRRVDVPWREWTRVWEAQTSAEILAATGAIAPDIEVLPPECKHAVKRGEATTGGFPAIAASSTTSHTPARLSPAKAPAPAAS
jgi:hypothetical protein